MVDSDAVLDFDGGMMRLERVAQEQELYWVVNQVATAYFGGQGFRRVSSDPLEIDRSEFELIARKGVAEDFRPPGQDIRDQLWAVVSGEGDTSSQLRRYIEVVDGHVDTALQRALLNAERPERNSAETQISACYVAVHYDIYKDRPVLKELNLFLSDVARILSRVTSKATVPQRH